MRQAQRLRQSFLHGQLNQIAFNADDAAFVVAVAGRPRAAYSVISVCAETLCQLVDFFGASQAERYVGVPSPSAFCSAVGNVRRRHNLKPRAAFKRQK